MKKGIIIIIAVIAVIIVSYCFINLAFIKKIKLEKDLNNIDLSNYDNLMIVAHPDDESIFGGGEIIKENYLVVCVTCGFKKNRLEEFKNEMHDTNDKYLALNYTDKIFFKRSKWLIEYSFINRDLDYIINYKNWNKIVTHNSKGEYGHQHHKMVHNIVEANADKDKLYVFERYCSKAHLLDGKCTLKDKIDNSLLLQKENLIRKNYKSQKRVIRNLEHIFPYEKIVKV